VKAIMLIVLMFVSSLIFPQESKLPEKVSVAEFPPEAIPSGICKQSYSGYLEIQEHGRPKDTNLSSQQIGEYIKKRLGEGYSLSLYPQASGRLFVIESCQSSKR